MIPIQVRVTKKLVAVLDELIEEGIYCNRSEAIRDAIRKHINEQQKNIQNQQKFIQHQQKQLQEKEIVSSI